MIRKVFRDWILLLALSAVASSTSTKADEGAFRVDPAKVLGAENCAECHASMVEAWKLTHHFDTFNSMHRRPEAKDISTKLGMRRIKDESLCIKCHYTSQAGDDGKPKAISGISCESCHSAGKDWNKVHSNKDDPERLAKAEKLGMLRPGNFYHVAANCYSCHTVPEEKLVNEGGHKAGSDFELVSWVAGEIRHNMQKSAGKVNEETPAPRRRMFFVIGQALDLEYGLRGLAKAAKDGPYLDSMTARVKAARGRLEGIQKVANLPELKAIIDAVNVGDLKASNEAALTKTADAVSETARKLAASNDGSGLAAVDALIPGPDKIKGKPFKP